MKEWKSSYRSPSYCSLSPALSFLGCVVLLVWKQCYSFGCTYYLPLNLLSSEMEEEQKQHTEFKREVDYGVVQCTLFWPLPFPHEFWMFHFLTTSVNGTGSHCEVVIVLIPSLCIWRPFFPPCAKLGLNFTCHFCFWSFSLEMPFSEVKKKKMESGNLHRQPSGDSHWGLPLAGDRCTHMLRWLWCLGSLPAGWVIGYRILQRLMRLIQPLLLIKWAATTLLRVNRWRVTMELWRRGKGYKSQLVFSLVLPVNEKGLYL